MADVNMQVNTGQFKKLRDMGDSTHAEVVHVANGSFAITQTIVPIGMSITQVVAANPLRKFLAWMVVGTADVTVAAGTAAQANAMATAAGSVGGFAPGYGLIYTGSGANKQGASEEFPNGAPTNAFQGIAAAPGTNLIVWEGQ